MNEQDLFLAALEIEDPAERQAHLEAVCRHNPELLARVKALLASHESRSRFLKVSLIEQVTGSSVGGTEPTLTIDGGSTEVGAFGAADAVSQPAETIALHEKPQSGEQVPLSYLAPASRPDALGRMAHYEALEIVGRGAFGTVLKAFDEKLHRVVAIKVLAPELAASERARQRFLREARASAAVCHENVVDIYAVEDKPIPCLVMEYVPGETLQQRLDAEGPLDLRDVLRIGKQIADGLAAAHARQLIHRDIKPDNVLLDGDRVKITDFGLARTADDASVSLYGLIAGTPMYMAPEQALGRTFDQRADLFSLGSVLYQMVSGRPPFAGTTTVAVLKQVAEDTPPPIQETVPDAPAWLCRLIGHLHAKDPDERYGSAREISDLLAACLADVKAGRTPTIPDPAHTAAEPAELVNVTQPRATRRRLRVAAIVLTLLLAGLGIAEVTGASHLAATVIRLSMGEGTLVIETDDPGIEVAVDGEEVHIRGAGIRELTLRPGDYTVAGLKDGEPFEQELVTITRNGRTPVRLSLESASANSNAATHPPVMAHQWPADAPPAAVAPFDAGEARQHQQAWADYLGVPVEKEVVLGQDADGKDVTLTMVLIPPGEFLMGSTEEEQEEFVARAKAENYMRDVEGIPGEGPRHRVRISKPFWFGRNEVTIEAFRRFAEARKYTTEPERDGLGGFGFLNGVWCRAPEFVWNRDPGYSQTDKHPVSNVTWNDATAFCAWLSQYSGLNFGLPTEAQWEYACRAGTNSTWPGGGTEDDVQRYGWVSPNADSRTHPVGQLAPNAFGLYDVHGNVWEWCADWYALDSYTEASHVDPSGPPSGTLRVHRGGGWMTATRRCRLAHRGRYTPNDRYSHLGFRVAASLPEELIRAK